MTKLPAIAGSAPADGRVSTDAAAAPVHASAAAFLGELIEALQPTVTPGIVASGSTEAHSKSDALPLPAASAEAAAPQTPEQSSSVSETGIVPAKLATIPPDASPARTSPPAPSPAGTIIASASTHMPNKTTGKRDDRSHAMATPLACNTLLPAIVPLPVARPQAAIESAEANAASPIVWAAPPAPAATTLALSTAALPPPAHPRAAAGPAKPDSAFAGRVPSPTPQPATSSVPVTPATSSNGALRQLRPREATGAEPSTHRSALGPIITLPSVQSLSETRAAGGQTSGPPSPFAAQTTTAQAAAPAAAQLGAALHASVTAPDGTRQLVLQLHPAELGHVTVQIVQPKDGPASVQIGVERPETMQLLMHDQLHLQRALDQAGIPVSGRVVSYNLAQPVGQPSGPGIADPDMGSRRREQGSRQRRTGQSSTFTIAAARLGATWLRAGIDITA